MISPPFRMQKLSAMVSAASLARNESAGHIIDFTQALQRQCVRVSLLASSDSGSKPVSTSPGATPLTRIPCGANSFAIARVIEISPPLAVETYIFDAPDVSKLRAQINDSPLTPLEILCRANVWGVKMFREDEPPTWHQSHSRTSPR